MQTIGAYAIVIAITALQLAGSSAGSDIHNPTTTHDDSTYVSTSDSSIVSTADMPAISTSHPTPSPSTTTTSTSVTTPVSRPSYPVPSTCASRTINWITHTLPQQCLKTSRTPYAGEVPETKDDTFAGPWALKMSEGGNNTFYRTPVLATGIAAPNSSTIEHSTTSVASASSSQPSAVEQAETGTESDSPLDNANFLSFEEWKRQNLAKVGQSPDNVGNPRPAAHPRKRPVINNALDTFGEEAEIELDFGFGSSEQSEGAWTSDTRGAAAEREKDDKVEITPSSGRSKDAGKTCKERFNYASFDCAATVLKTNPQCKSSSSVLVENKDSYMLNECRADNKFLIVELCDDILVDTVVLANFEFFSSMFRTFRVSVSDRYPVKMDRWRVLGTFEARNSRDIQAFLVETPLIWARYLRVEFLTHYGNEFYCPMSLLRVHGTTMMEEFKNQEDQSREGYYEPTLEQAVEGEVISGVPAIKVAPDSQQPDPEKPVVQPDVHTAIENNTESSPTSTVTTPKATEESSKIAEVVEDTLESRLAPRSDDPDTGSRSSDTIRDKNDDATTSDKLQNGTFSESIGPSENATEAAPVEITPPSSNVETKPSSQETHNNSSESPATPPKTHDSPSNVPSIPQGEQASQQQQSQYVPRPTPTGPPNANPTTQESFFKSIHKRLQQLEANSTLSLQYIEEQSRILRDAFIKVERRQVNKTETFLQNLNSTVLKELRGFHQQYDLLWQSTVLELETQRDQHAAEMYAISSRLSILADELVFQKRMAVVQSTLLLLCLGLVLFVRSGLEATPIYQHVSSFKDSWRLISPPTSPPQQRWTQRLRATMSEVNLRRDTPTSSAAPTDDEVDTDDMEHHEHGHRPSPLRHNSRDNGPVKSAPPEVSVHPPSPDTPPESFREAQSGPATPRGSRERSVIWGEEGVGSPSAMSDEDPFLEKGVGGVEEVLGRLREEVEGGLNGKMEERMG